MSSEDRITFIAVFAFCVLIYIAAFATTYVKKQSVTVYVVLLAIQLLFLLYEVFEPSNRDGMGNAYFHLILLSIQLILAFTAGVVLLVRVSSVVFWKYFAGITIPLVALVLLCRHIHIARNRNTVEYKLYSKTFTSLDEAEKFLDELAQSETAITNVPEQNIITIKAPKTEEEFVNLFASVVKKFREAGEDLPEYFDEPNICDDCDFNTIVGMLSSYYLFETEKQVVLLEETEDTYLVAVVKQHILVK